MDKGNVNLTRAAVIARKSRQTIHKDAKSGKLSVTRDRDGKPQVEISELARVYGDLYIDSADVSDSQEATPQINSEFAVVTARLAAAEQIIQMKDQLLEEKDLRIADLQHTVLLLSNIKPDSELQPEKPRRKLFGLF